MPDISLGEFILILLITIVFVGPERIPEITRKIGDFIAMLRDAFSKVKEDVTKDEDAAEVFNEMQNTVSEIANAVNIRKAVREIGSPLLDKTHQRNYTKYSNGEENQDIDPDDKSTDNASGENISNVAKMSLTKSDNESEKLSEKLSEEKDALNNSAIPASFLSNENSHKITKDFKKIK